LVCRPMELQGAIEVVQDLRTCHDLRLPDRLLLPLVMEKLQRDPGLDDCPCWGPSDVPSSSISAQTDVNSAILSAALAAATGSMSLESPNSSLLSGSCTIGTIFPGAVCAVTAATTPSSRPPKA